MARLAPVLVVQDLVKHVLHHVDAEAAERDSSQVAGVADRAQYVRDTVAGFKTDMRVLSLDVILEALSNAAALSVSQAAFKRSVANMRAEGETRPQLAIQAWVGKNREMRGG